MRGPFFKRKPLKKGRESVFILLLRIEKVEREVSLFRREEIPFSENDPYLFVDAINELSMLLENWTAANAGAVAICIPGSVGLAVMCMC